MVSELDRNVFKNHLTVSSDSTHAVKAVNP